jgi:hypothetical protein
VGERVGDDEVLSPHDAHAELPDHMLRSHGADGAGFFQTNSCSEQGEGRELKEQVAGWMWQTTGGQHRVL